VAIRSGPRCIRSGRACIRSGRTRILEVPFEVGEARIQSALGGQAFEMESGFGAARTRDCGGSKC
jgi:hypothetical protein